MKKYACWCVYEGRADKWVKVSAHSKEDAKQMALKKEASRGIRGVWGVKEVNELGLYV